MASTQVGKTVNWDANNKHVDPSIDENGVAVQAHTVLIAVGAPTLSTNGQSVAPGQSLADLAWPIGTAENIGIGQNKQLQQFFEIGSKRRYFVPGRVINSLQLNRVYLNGASLLKVLWAYYNNPENTGSKGWNQKPQINTSLLNVGRKTGGTFKVENDPGVGHLWLNMASELFDKPIGMLLYFKNNFGANVGAIYLEGCNIANHSFSISASSTLFSESVSMQFDAIKPVNIFQGAK